MRIEFKDDNEIPKEYYSKVFNERGNRASNEQTTRLIDTRSDSDSEIEDEIGEQIFEEQQQQQQRQQEINVANVNTNIQDELEERRRRKQDENIFGQGRDNLNNDVNDDSDTTIETDMFEELIDDFLANNQEILGQGTQKTPQREENERKAEDTIVVEEVIWQVSDENNDNTEIVTQIVTDNMMGSQSESESHSVGVGGISRDDQIGLQLNNKDHKNNIELEIRSPHVEALTSIESDIITQIRDLKDKVKDINDTINILNKNSHSNNDDNNENNDNDDINTLSKTDYAYRIHRHSYLISCDDNSLTFLGCLYLSYFGNEYSQVAIKNDLPRKPGDCIPLSNKDADVRPFITIELFDSIQIQEIGIYHIRPHWLPIGEIGSAPQVIAISVSNDGKEYFSIGEHFYDYTGEPFQIFELNNWKYPPHLSNEYEKEKYDTIQKEKLNQSWKYVGLEFITNGGADYTCIYRTRVYGHVVEN